jgi:hypothetical protein
MARFVEKPKSEAVAMMPTSNQPTRFQRRFFVMTQCNAKSPG